VKEKCIWQEEGPVLNWYLKMKEEKKTGEIKPDRKSKRAFLFLPTCLVDLVWPLSIFKPNNPTFLIYLSSKVVIWGLYKLLVFKGIMGASR
jgi:hypothetical protein